MKINGFGKIKNTEFKFTEGINIVYGENEAGKSTILKFIEGMLYGLSKNKNGKNISDFEKYKPWDNSEFSGKIKYRLQNGEEYEIFREFPKKNPLIYNRLGEEISREFHINKLKRINFFEEQLGVDEISFLKTAIIHQQEVKIGKMDTNYIIEKISNLVCTGDTQISFEKSMEKLNKMQNDIVGTERTKQKPINIVDNKIKELLENKKKWMMYKQKEKEYLEEKQKNNMKLNGLEIKKQFLKEVKEYLSEKKMKEAEIEFEKNLEEEYACKADEVRKKIDKEEPARQSKCKDRYKLVFFIVLAIIIIAFVRNIVADLIAFIPVGIMIGIMKRKRRTSLNKLSNINQELEKEYEIVLNQYYQKKKEVKDKEKNQSFENSQNQKAILNKYKKNMEETYVKRVLNMSFSEIEDELEMLENAINKINLQNGILENQDENMDKELEELAKIEESLAEQYEIKNELISLDTSFHLAKECLEHAYDEVKQNISPRFKEKMCEVISDITDKKYENIMLNDETGLKVEIKNGAYIPVEQLSVGTIDEMYLSLRLSAFSELANESLPIFLDESFAFFDNNRLKNVLCYLQDKHYDNQIIIFTCSNREENILNQLKIEYNLINLK